MKHLRPEDFLSSVRLPRFTGQTTITHNATSLFLPGESDLTLDANDQITAVSDASGNWRVINIQKNLAPARGKITANRTYYVRTDGSDTNTGLANTSGGAFKTIQKAYDVIAGTIDLGGFTVTIQIGDGTYAPTSGVNALNITQPWTGGGQVVIQGNNGTPANVVLSSTNADAILVTTSLPGILTVKDLKITAATNGNGLNNSGVGTVNFQNINFGAIAYYQAAVVGTGAVMVATGAYTVSGGGFGHALAASGGFLFTENLTVTLSGTPAFSFAYATAKSLGGYIADGMTFSGTGATGKRYDVSINSIINTVTATATYFPGNASGTTATGGQYL